MKTQYTVRPVRAVPVADQNIHTSRAQSSHGAEKAELKEVARGKEAGG